MSLSQARIGELKKILGHYAVNQKREALNATRDILGELRFSGAITAMGCQENCSICPWGAPGAKEWDNPCRLWSLWEKLSDLEARAVPGPEIRKQAADLLAALEAAPAPR